MARALVLAAVALGFAAALPTAEAGNKKKPASKSAAATQAFEKADTNKDGTLSIGEFQKFLTEAKAKKAKVK